MFIVQVFHSVEITINYEELLMAFPIVASGIDQRPRIRACLFLGMKLNGKNSLRIESQAVGLQDGATVYDRKLEGKAPESNGRAFGKLRIHSDEQAVLVFLLVETLITE